MTSPKIWSQAEVEGMLKMARYETRALAMEEAARFVEPMYGYEISSMPTRLRALAPMPPSMVIVPVTTLRDWWERLEYDEEGEPHVRAALSALLSKVKP